MLIYILGILVLIYLHYECYRVVKRYENVEKTKQSKEIHCRKSIEETKLLPIKKTAYTLGIFIGYDFDIQFSDLNHTDNIKYMESSLQPIKFTQTYKILNEEEDIKKKLYLILQTFHDLYPVQENEENLIFLWICSTSTFAQTKTKKIEKVLKLGHDYLYESDLNFLFNKYNSSKFICGFQTKQKFLPNLCIEIDCKITNLEDNEKNEKKSKDILLLPEKKEYKEEIKDFSIIVPFDLKYVEKEFKKIQIEFYEISDILQKTLEWKFHSLQDKTNQFVWCLNGENLSKMFVLYLQVLGFDTPIESISTYLKEHDIQQNFGKLFPSQYQFSSLFN